MTYYNKNKGDKYEVQIQEYLIIHYTEYQTYLWKDVPLKYIIKYVFDEPTKYNFNNILEDIDNEDINNGSDVGIINNEVMDTGCDILMVNKNDDNDVIIVQCKNYANKNVCIKDLSGFFYLIALSHLPVKGLIISNTDISNRIDYKLKLSKNVKFLNIPYNDEPCINYTNIIIPRDYQLEIVDKFKNINEGILQLFCGMGKTYTSLLIAKEFKNIIILSPLRSYAYQLLNVFTSTLINYSSNLISSDGSRDINNILKSKQEMNIYSSTFCSSDIMFELIDELDNIILIVDEFHNLSYNHITDVNNCMYKILTSNKITKKLFMSATPKVYINEIEEESVNNYTNIFGDIFYNYGFIKAINNKYINDYQLIIPDLETEKNKYEFIYANMLYHGYKKCLIYCQNINEANIFEQQIETINKSKYNFNIYVNTITYNTTLNKRNKILNKFVEEKYKLSFIISVHILDECIDIPTCDSVYITYPVQNSINVIQRISRCLRIYPNKIKSGIFLWCEKYNEIKKITNIIHGYDVTILNKIYIKNDNSNSSKITDVRNMLTKCSNELHNLDDKNEDNKFIDIEKLNIINDNKITYSNNLNIYEKLDKNIIKFEDNDINVIIDENKIVWFGAKTIAIALGYKDYKDAIKQHINKEDIKQKKYIKYDGIIKQHSQTLYINEAGLYTLIFASKLQKSKIFKHWITREVLPSIHAIIIN